MLTNNMKTALCVPSFGHRTTELLEHMDSYNGNNYDMFVFVQDNDINLNKYYEDNYSNVNIVKTSASCICENRQAIIDYCIRNGYDKVIMCDCDMGATAGKITPESKRTTSNSYRKIIIDIFELFDKMCDVCDEYDAGMVGVSHDMYIGFSKPGKVSINKSLNLSGIIMFDLNKTFRLYDDIHYCSSDEHVEEDIDIAIKIRKHGIDIITIKDYAFSFIKGYGASVIFENIDKRNRNIFNTAKKWYLPLSFDKQNKIRLTVPWKRYDTTDYIVKCKNNFENELFRMYDNNATYEEVYEFLMNNKQNKI